MKNVSKEEFALLYAQESLFWDLANSVNFKGPIKVAYSNFCRFVEEQSRLVKDSKNIDISGSYNDNEPWDSSHYDIENALIKKFGKDALIGDSYSDCLVVSVNDKITSKVEAFLKKNYPNLVFETNVKDEPVIFPNWSYAEKYCKDNNIKVELPSGYITADMLEHHQKVMAKQEELARVQKELEDLLK